MPAWLEVSLRTVMAVIILFIMTRILGKRQISQLSLFEYITGISIGNLAAYLSLDTDTNWILGVVALSVWVSMSLGIEFLQMKSKKARELLDGKPTIIIQNGKILEANMKRERITSDELLELLRTKDIFDVSQVEFAIMDTSGELNVLLKKEHQPLTPSDINLPVSPEKFSMSVIMDGKILEDSLKRIGLNRDWLAAKLKRIGTSPDKIYLAQVDSQNKLYLDPYEDSIKTH
jgi:Predicted membrane protein